MAITSPAMRNRQPVGGIPILPQYAGDTWLATTNRYPANSGAATLGANLLGVGFKGTGSNYIPVPSKTYDRTKGLTIIFVAGNVPSGSANAMVAGAVGPGSTSSFVWLFNGSSGVRVRLGNDFDFNNVDTTKMHTYVFVLPAGSGSRAASLYQDGRLVGTTTALPTVDLTINTIGDGYDTGLVFPLIGSVNLFHVINRPVGNGRDLSGNPWQIFSPMVQPLYFDAGGAAAPSGTFASTLDGVVLAAAGIVENPGVFASTLGGVSLAATGTVGDAVTGTFASTLSGVSMAASGTITNVGSFSATLAGVTLAAAGTVAPHVTGTFASTLDGVSMSASGFVGVPPVSSGFTQRRRMRSHIVVRGA